MRAASLRLRLVLVILPPLMSIALLAGAWQLANARATAQEVGDRRLLLTALAVAYDVTLSGGDALAPGTRDLLQGRDGPLFYHVYAPDGVIVAGFATPPVGIPRSNEPGAPVWFEAAYRGAPVRGVRVVTQGEVDGIAGRITTTVWRGPSEARALVLTLMARTLAVIGALTGSVVLVVWFGVRLGLRPLSDLEAAIARRSSDDLSAIRRPVPAEVRGVVDRLNALFGQVRRVMAAQADFVADAAHQLRNPVAGILSLAEAVARAPDAAAARRRARDLVEAARDAAALTEALLLLERASAAGHALRPEPTDLGALLRARVDAARPPDGVSLTLDAEGAGRIECDPILLGEAVTNLIDNALRHGGPDLTRVEVRARRDAREVRIAVRDDGRGVPAQALSQLTARFHQVRPGQGSGLGLSIALAVAEAHGGRLTVHNDDGLTVEIGVPVAAS
ncbi:MAG: sensor histidine kinase [Shimia sp.]